MNLVARDEQALAEAEQIERLEGALLELPQVACPVAHHFGPGLYIREVTLPAGALVVGHHQRHEHLNVMLAGVVTIATDDGIQTLRGPLTIIGKPGRKVGYVLETVVWQNIYANPTNERDVDKLEAMHLDKSATWAGVAERTRKAERAARDADRHDFAELLRAGGFDADAVRAQAEATHDIIDMPREFAPRLRVGASLVEGRGLFATMPVAMGELIAPARLGGMRTPAGRYTNHAREPNAAFVMAPNGDIWLVATRNIVGCVGSAQGEEITVDYRQALALSGILVPKADT